MNKQQLVTALLAFTDQRSGIEWCNYTTREDFMEDYNGILRHGRIARQLLHWINWHESITADDILQQCTSRLTIEPNGSLDYCAGQYWPVEYRQAVCRMCASVIWSYFRDKCNCTTADQIRSAARKEFGRGIAQSFFR